MIYDLEVYADHYADLEALMQSDAYHNAFLPPEERRCEACDGEGYTEVLETCEDPFGGFYQDAVPVRCGPCGGTGLVYKEEAA